MTSQWQPVDLLRELWTKLLAWPHLLKITAGVLLIIAVIQALFDRVAAGSLVAALFVTKRASAASSARASMVVRPVGQSGKFPFAALERVKGGWTS